MRLSSTHRLSRPALSLLCTAALAACGGGGVDGVGDEIVAALATSEKAATAYSANAAVVASDNSAPVDTSAQTAQAVVAKKLALGACASLAKGTLTSFSIDSGGTARTGYYFLPENYSCTARLPFVVALHGHGQRAKVFSDDLPVHNYASAKNLAVIYLDGTCYTGCGSYNTSKRSWADFRGTSEASIAGVNDLSFIKQVVQQFVDTQVADPNNVTVTGFSNGSMMTHTVACLQNSVGAFAQKIYAFSGDFTTGVAPIGPLAGQIPSNVCTGTQFAALRSAIVVHGDSDPLSPFNGGTSTGICGEFGVGGTFLGAPNTFQKYASALGCSTPAVTSSPIIDAQPSPEATKFNWTVPQSCPTNKSVRLAVAYGGGHSVTRAVGNGPNSMICIGKISHEDDGAASVATTAVTN
jgi:poly(3-hydroxybutyrate) depolymerase